MLSAPGQRVIEKINRTRSPIKRMELALRFFVRSENYRTEPIGWGEDYQPVYDDGQEVARVALRKFHKHGG